MSNFDTLMTVLDQAEIDMDKYAELTVLLINMKFDLKLAAQSCPEAEKTYARLTGEDLHAKAG